MEHNRTIAILGSANMDLVIPVDRLARAGETISGGDLALFPGGKGANQACVAGKLGGCAVFIGQVGDDPFGARLIASLKHAAVDTSRVAVSDRATGTAAIFVLASGENSIVISPGANGTMLPASALPKLDLLDGSSLLLCQLEIPLVTVQAALAKAKANGAITILDPAPARLLPPEVLSCVDFLTPNQTEAATLLGHPESEISSPREAAEAAEQLLALGPKSVILKLGSQGCYIAAGSIRTAIPAFQVTAVDSTAAGDIFNGAFAVALSEGQDVVEAAEFASAAAAISVTRRGAQSSIPTRDEVASFLQARCGASVHA